MVDDIKNQLGSGVVLLANVNQDKIGLIAGVTKDLVWDVKAVSWLKWSLNKSVSKGGGRLDMARLVYRCHCFTNSNRIGSALVKEVYNVTTKPML